ncbi:hypothetical protein PRUPE_1G228900 [Prunus persica]|uniref:Mannosyl-oligosaccharide glucosidase n=1 Tax=Prunus persica TaxID=3760 RepID=A0A251R212_PRUPE|nr:mannosyl-oligosaccharide glucosidase GCS1 isoform X3 [Prunus persica]ONI30057.1 hypothetical protein PRUPE_1G228900 [Prunus persica]
MSATETSVRSRAKSHSDAEDDNDRDAVTLRRTETNSRPLRDRSRSHTSIGSFNVDLKRLLGLGAFGFFVALLFIFNLVNPVREANRARGLVRSSPTSELMDTLQSEGENKESLYWGTYRPRVYLGIRSRTPRSLIAGLMWIGGNDGKSFLRHVRKDSDELSIYSWAHHDDYNFGHQVIVDHDMNLATSFFKSKGEDSGYGGDWVVRIDVRSHKYSHKSKRNEEFWRSAHLFFYLADEDGNALTLGGDNLGIRESSPLASGLRTDIGSWQLHLKSRGDVEVHYFGFKMPHTHNLSDIVQEYLEPQVRKFGPLQLPDISDKSPNILVFQISAKIPFKTDIAFISGTDLESSRVEERVSSLTGTSLTSQLMEKQREFDTKFEKSFDQPDKVVSQALGFIQKAWGNAQRFVKDAQNGDTHTAIHHAVTEYKQFLFNQSAKLWVDQYPKVQSVAEKASSAASYWSQKYKHVVKDLTLKGYNISGLGYLPLVPIDKKMTKAPKHGEARK